MVRLREGEQECNNRTQTLVHPLRQDKSTGTLRAQVLDGIRVLQGPAFHSLPWVFEKHNENNAILGTWPPLARRSHA